MRSNLTGADCGTIPGGREQMNMESWCMAACTGPAVPNRDPFKGTASRDCFSPFYDCS